MPGSKSYDDAVVGAGILGLAHAYHLARRGRRVIVFERNPRAIGASVRNFGMLWPIGQPIGPLRRLAARSLQIWLEVLESSGLWHERTGSLHLAYRDDEAQVLREFAHECARPRRAGRSAHARTGPRADDAAVKQDGTSACARQSSRSMCRSAGGRRGPAGLARTAASASISSSAGRSPPSRCPNSARATKDGRPTGSGFARATS